MTFDELIARLESLDGPDREVDAEIAKKIGWKLKKSILMSNVYWLDQENAPRPEVPHFTGSLDVAGMLVPDGWLTTLHIHENRSVKRAVCHAELTHDADMTGRDLNIDAPYDVEAINAPNAAIALCTAALKARKAMETK